MWSSSGASLTLPIQNLSLRLFLSSLHHSLLNFTPSLSPLPPSPLSLPLYTFFLSLSSITLFQLFPTSLFLSSPTDGVFCPSPPHSEGDSSDSEIEDCVDGVKSWLSKNKGSTKTLSDEGSLKSSRSVSTCLSVCLSASSVDSLYVMLSSPFLLAGP